MSHVDRISEPDDFFAETRMTFGEHIEDLRRHLIRALLGFAIGVVISFFIGKPVLDFIAAPVEQQLGIFYKRYNREQRNKALRQLETDPSSLRTLTNTFTIPLRDLKIALGLEKDDAPRLDLIPVFRARLEELEVDWLVNWKELQKKDYFVITEEPRDALKKWEKAEGLLRPPVLSTLSVQEAFVVYFKVCMLTGLVITSPWVFYQVWAFIAAGLYPHEKKYVNVFLPFSLGLFLSGIAICEFFVMPNAISALLWFNDYLNLRPDLRLNEWLGFAIMLPLVFGVSFQTPLVMLFMQRVGFLTVEMFRKFRRIAWFALAIFAAIITPTTDPITMMFLWLPTALLYELGIAMCTYLPGRPLIDLEPEPDEMVEV